MKKDIGFILLSIDNSKSYDIIFKCLEDMSKDNPYNQVCVFNSQNKRIDNKRIPIFHLNQAKFFNGNLFVFDTVSLLFAKNFVCVEKIYFYVSSPLWIGKQYSNYYEIHNLFNQENLEFVANSQEISSIYEICWKKPITISEDMSYESIKKII